MTDGQTGYDGLLNCYRLTAFHGFAVNAEIPLRFIVSLCYEHSYVYATKGDRVDHYPGPQYISNMGMILIYGEKEPA